MNIQTRPAHKFVELIVEEGGTTVTTAIFQSDPQELNQMITHLLDAAYDLAIYSDKSLEEHLKGQGLL
jgi:hypothetical protein